MNISKSERYQWILFLSLAVGGLVWIVCWAAPQTRYSWGARRINDKICALRACKPTDVTDEMWEECVAWASIAHSNICFSRNYTSYPAMRAFEKDLDEKLKGEINLSTIEWIGHRLEETGPNGKNYFPKVHWWEQWESIVERIEQENNRSPRVDN